MKKMITIMTAAALVLAVTSCASTKKADAPAADGKETVACINNPDPTGNVELLDSFEEGNYWQAVGDTWDQWGAHNLSLEAETTDAWATEGTNSASWTFDVAGPDTSKQACFFCDALIDVDWTGAKYLVADVNNINKEPISLSVAVQATDGWTWSQTAPITVGVGVNKNVMFDLVTGVGSKGTGIDGPEMIKRGIIQVVGENAGGTIYVDNIRLVR